VKCAVAGFDYEPTGGAPGSVSFKAERTISSSGCWYFIAVFTSTCPMVCIKSFKFPVFFSTRVPKSWRPQ